MMDFALSSVRLTASGVEMSGLGAPFCTASAKRSLAMTVALPGTMLPVLSASAKGANSSDTSKAWPLATVFLVLTPVPYVTLTCVPVLASKRSSNFSIVALIGSGDRRVISLWARAVDEMLSARATTATEESRYFKVSSSNLAVIRLRLAVVLSRLRFGFPDRRVPYYVVKMALFRRRTDLLENCHFRTHKSYLVAHPRSGIRLWIGESHVQLQGLSIDPFVALHEVHLVAVRIAEMIDPGSVVIALGLNDECVSLPLANRVSVPTRIRILRKLPPIRPDGAPQIMILHVLQHPGRSLHEFKWSEVRFPQIARITHRFASRNWVIPLSRGHGPRAIADLRGIELRLSPRRHRRRISV